MKDARRLVAVPLFLLAAAAAGAAQDEKPAELRKKLETTLERVAADLDGVMGYAVVDLTSGDRIEKLPAAVFATASTIKLSILYELFRQADEGKIRLDEMRPLGATQRVGGTGILTELSAPAMPIRDYATLMVVLSDNTATNLLIDVVGMHNVTARMASLGLKETKLRRKMIDAAAARRGDENVSTPAEIAKLLELIHRGGELTRPSQESLLSILKKAKATAMRRGIPQAVQIANKPGTLEGVEVDAGIVYVPGRPYVFVVMTGYLNDNAAGEAAITAASKAAYDYFNRIARTSEYGGRSGEARLQSSPVLEIQIGLLDVQPHGASAEGRDVVDLPLHAHVSALGRHAVAARKDGHLPRPVVDLVHADRHHRNAP